MSPWGFCCYEEGEQALFARLEQSSWEAAPLAAGLRGDGRAEALEALLPGRQAQPALARDAVFLEALRDAALLASLDGASRLRCRIREDQRDLAEAVLCDLYCNALPRLHFLPFAMGTESPPAPGFRLLFLTDFPDGEFDGAFADFTQGQPSLQLNFPRLSFAQRTLRALLPPLGLGLLLSMFNAAGHVSEARIGARKTAEYTDLVTWLMLRRSFPSNEYPITGPEHEQLQERVMEFEAHA